MSTLERMQHRRDGDKLFISNCEHLVIDEFDTFVDSGHEQAINRLLEQLLDPKVKSIKRTIRPQIIFASATVSKHIKKIAKDFFGDRIFETIHLGNYLSPTRAVVYRKFVFTKGI